MPMLDPDQLRPFAEVWPVYAALATLVVGGIMLYLRRHFVSRSGCKEIRSKSDQRQAEQEARLDDGASRMQAIEASLAALPTRGDLHALELKLEGLSGRLRELEAVLNGQSNLMRRVEHQLDRMDNYLLGGGNRS